MDKISALSNNVADLEDIERLNESIRVIQSEIFARTLAKESLEQALAEADEERDTLSGRNKESGAQTAAHTAAATPLAASASKKSGPTSVPHAGAQWDAGLVNVHNKRALLTYVANRTESIKSIIVVIQIANSSRGRRRG